MVQCLHIICLLRHLWNHGMYTVEPLLRGHPDERPSPLERPLDNVNLNIDVLIFTPDERPPLLKGHFSYAKGVASQERFHCTSRIVCAHLSRWSFCFCCDVNDMIYSIQVWVSFDINSRQRMEKFLPVVLHLLTWQTMELWYHTSMDN